MPSVSVVPHGKGFRCVWREGGRGSKRHVSQTRANKREATEDADAIKARIQASEPLKQGRVRLGWAEVVERWHESRPVGRYRTESRAILQSILWRTTEDATPDAVAKLKLGARRLVNSVLHFARIRLKQAVDLCAIEQPLPRSSRTRKAEQDLLPNDDADALVREATRWSIGNGAIAHFCATYGHRAQSLVGLTGDAIDVRAWTIELPVKGGGVVRHPLLPETIAIVKTLQPGKGKPLFISHLGKPWPTGKHFSQWFYHRVGPAALAVDGEAGPKIGYYQTKSAAITAMLEATNNDAKTVASITGHKRPSLLIDVYARTNAAKQMQALRGARPVG